GRATAIAAAALSAVAPAARAEPVAETSLTPTGAQIGESRLRDPRPVVRVVEVAPDGTRGTTVTVSDRSRAARLVGGTQVKAGAVAVAFDQQLGDGRWEPMLAYRPAGSTLFLPSVATGPAHRDTTAGHADPVVLGPDGSGIVLGFGSTHRDTFVKRLSADGTLGPAIVIAPRSIGSVLARAEVSASGTVVIAIAARQAVDGLYDDEPAFASSIYATTLPAGASRPTPLQHLSTSANPDDALPSLAVVVDEDDYAVVEAGRFAPSRTESWAGPATDLR
ncbi:MAG: hypothetical protein Q7T55_06160, partial [Solirubrobacteraceae bacterium]|nr:hypothetical protein [Solirubrobacteraceae bacterium]